MAIDKNMLEVFGGIFESQQAAEEFMKIVDGKPKRFMEELYLQGDFTGHIEIRFFEKKTNRAEEMQEKKTDEYHIFRIENVYPYK